jgi:hypothetical protein
MRMNWNVLWKREIKINICDHPAQNQAKVALLITE